MHNIFFISGTILPLSTLPFRSIPRTAVSGLGALFTGILLQGERKGNERSFVTGMLIGSVLLDAHALGRELQSASRNALVLADCAVAMVTAGLSFSFTMGVQGPLRRKPSSRRDQQPIERENTSDSKTRRWVNPAISFYHSNGGSSVSCSKVEFYGYNCDPTRETAGWGCAYHALQIVVSHFEPDAIPSVASLQEAFCSEEAFEKKFGCKAPLSDYSRVALRVGTDDWAEPWHTRIWLEKVLKQKTSLIFAEFYPDQCTRQGNRHTPDEGFDQAEGKPVVVVGLDAVFQTLWDHFTQEKTPIILDNTKYTMTICGVERRGEEQWLWVLDPHDTDMKVGHYRVRLDPVADNCKFECSGGQEREEALKGRWGLSHWKQWMLLLPKKRAFDEQI